MSNIKKIKVGDTTYDIERSVERINPIVSSGTINILPGVMTCFRFALSGDVTITTTESTDTTVANIYAMQFRTSLYFGSITWPTGWIISPDAPAIESDNAYEVNVLNNYVLISVWEGE